jgi:hypothetical protein
LPRVLRSDDWTVPLRNKRWCSSHFGRSQSREYQ